MSIKKLLRSRRVLNGAAGVLIVGIAVGTFQNFRDPGNLNSDNENYYNDLPGNTLPHNPSRIEYAPVSMSPDPIYHGETAPSGGPCEELIQHAKAACEVHQNKGTELTASQKHQIDSAVNALVACEKANSQLDPRGVPLQFVDEVDTALQRLGDVPECNKAVSGPQGNGKTRLLSMIREGKIDWFARFKYGDKNYNCSAQASASGQGTGSSINIYMLARADSSGLDWELVNTLLHEIGHTTQSALEEHHSDATFPLRDYTRYDHLGKVASTLSLADHRQLAYSNFINCKCNLTFNGANMCMGTVALKLDAACQAVFGPSYASVPGTLGASSYSCQSNDRTQQLTMARGCAWLWGTRVVDTSTLAQGAGQARCVVDTDFLYNNFNKFTDDVSTPPSGFDPGATFGGTTGTDVNNVNDVNDVNDGAYGKGSGESGSWW